MPLNANSAEGESLLTKAKSTAGQIIGFPCGTKIGSIIDHRTSEVVTISPHGNLKAVANLMRDQQVPAVVVLWNKQIVGLVTERDVVDALSIHNKTAGFVWVKDAMSRPVVSISLDDTVEHAMLLMVGKRCHHLPIVNNGKLVGMLGLDYILKILASKSRTCFQTGIACAGRTAARDEAEIMQNFRRGLISILRSDSPVS